MTRRQTTDEYLAEQIAEAQQRRRAEMQATLQQALTLLLHDLAPGLLAVADTERIHRATAAALAKAARPAPSAHTWAPTATSNPAFSAFMRNTLGGAA